MAAPGPTAEAAARASIWLTLQPNGTRAIRRRARADSTFAVASSVDTTPPGTIIVCSGTSCAEEEERRLLAGMKVLLIEYEPRYVDRVRALLMTRGHEVVACRDGEEGLEAYRRMRPDLVLIASVLPKLRTPDVIKGMQATGPTPPILLMMSGYKGRNKRADAQRVGATSILEKPFGDEVLEAEVAAALGQGPAPQVSSSKLRKAESSGPLLSADDIFSEIVSGIEGPKDDEDASGKSGTPPGAAVAPGAFDTVQVKVEELAAPSAPLSSKPSEKPPERPAERRMSGSASVDDLLRDTLSGLKIRPRSASTGTTDPGLPIPAPPRPVSGSGRFS